MATVSEVRQRIRITSYNVCYTELLRTVPPYGVYLVDEYYAGGALLRLLEEVAYAGGADANEHLDKVRAADTEERNSRLSGNRSRKKCLSRSRRPDEQYALRDLVITSYSIHYTKLYDGCGSSAARRC